jgi:hypothetical protein
MSGQTRDPRTKRQSLERSAGTPEPAKPDSYYCLQPGEGESPAEYFPDTLQGQSDAIARAVWLSMGRPDTFRVLATHPEGGNLPACTDKVFQRYRGGQQIWSASSAVTPAPAAADPGPAPAARLAAVRPDAPAGRKARQGTAARPAPGGLVMDLRGM